MAIYISEDEYDREELDDLRLSIRLLAGTHEADERGLPVKRYLSKVETFVARKAIARLLRNPKPFDTALRRQLAALFDPETEDPPYSSPDAAPMEREIILKGRHKGGAKIQNRRKREIAIALDNLRRRDPQKPRDDAIHEIAEQFSVSPRTVEEAAAHLKAVTGR
jgi:hypothetical protein